uniref:MHC class I-like antigen recognition-like domain-containing protein n=1 Tax=Cyprinodon variegatus TaxID=28743 RepID=A0A3Q2GI57_CYPVA
MVFCLPLLFFATVTPSLKYSTCTTSPELTTFPEFVEVELVDEQPVSYYDSVLRKKIPKQDWMAKSEGPGSWKRILPEKNLLVQIKFLLR